MFRPGKDGSLLVSSSMEPISSECKEKGQELKEKVQSFKDACQADAQKFCSDVKPGGGRILACLKNHTGDLAPACQDAMSHGSGHHS